MGKQANTDELKVLTLNTWGLLYISQDLNERMNAIAEELSKGTYDLVFLQEVWSARHYNVIRAKVEAVLPHSHYFLSGFLGSGCAIFSKYPIADTLYHKYSLNGYFWDYLHCDWYAGKGVAFAVVQHPNGVIYTFNTHIHADDPKENNCEGVSEMRTLQCYQLAQFVNIMTRPGDAVIISGDMNHVPNSLGIETISLLASVQDTYNIAPVRPAECFTVNKEVNKYLPEKEITSRLDYILVSDAFECKSCKLAMQRIPDSDLHYSDHDGYSTYLSFKKTSNGFDSTYETTKSESRLPVPCSEYQILKVHNEALDTLNRLNEVMKNGERISSQINLMKAVPIFTSFTLFVVLPLLSSENTPVFAFIVGSLFPLSWQLKQLIHVLQLISLVVSSVVLSGYLWVIFVVRRMDVNEFKAARDHIKTKIKQLKTTEIVETLT